MGNVALYVFLGLVGIIGFSFLYTQIKYPQEGLFAEDSTPRNIPQIVPRTAPLDMEQVAALIHEKSNRERQIAGVRALSYDTALADIAMSHSVDMSGRNYFEHESPEGDGPRDRYREARYPCNSSGENLFFHGRASLTAEGLAESIMQGWLDSEGHKENILRPQYSREGIGIVYDEDQSAWLATANFC